MISEDTKTISKANGVGAKGASRIILELKDKLKMEDMMDAAYEQSIVQDTQDLNAARDAILALVNLGYSNSEAALAVKKDWGYQSDGYRIDIKGSIEEINIKTDTGGHSG